MSSKCINFCTSLFLDCFLVTKHGSFVSHPQSTAFILLHLDGIPVCRVKHPSLGIWAPFDPQTFSINKTQNHEAILNLGQNVLITPHIYYAIPTKFNLELLPRLVICILHIKKITRIQKFLPGKGGVRGIFKFARGSKTYFIIR